MFSIFGKANAQSSDHLLMRTIWLSAHLSPKLADWIAKEFGVNCMAVRDIGLREASDIDIFSEAKRQNAVIMTKDSDQG